MDYPYAIGAMPAWPVNASCAMLVAAGSSSAKLIAAAAEITALTIAGSRSPTACIPTPTEGPGGVPGDGPVSRAIVSGICAAFFQRVPAMIVRTGR